MVVKYMLSHFIVALQKVSLALSLSLFVNAGCLIGSEYIYENKLILVCPPSCFWHVLTCFNASYHRRVVLDKLNNFMSTSCFSRLTFLENEDFKSESAIFWFLLVKFNIKNKKIKIVNLINLIYILI